MPASRALTPETGIRVAMAALLLIALALFVLYFADAVPGGTMAIGVNASLGVALVLSFILKRRERRARPAAAASSAAPARAATKRKRRKR